MSSEMIRLVVVAISIRLAFASSPYSIYILNTFPMDRNRTRFNQMASHRSKTPGTVSDYSEFYQPETGVLGWTAGESREEALRRMVDEQVDYLRASRPMSMLHYSSKMCGDKQTTERRIHTVITERNVPYEIPCSACYLPDISLGPYFFYIFEGQPDEALDAPISRWTPASVFLHKYVVRDRDRAGGIFAMQRSVDGKLLIDPGPISKWKGPPTVDFNSLTIACAYEREDDGKEVLMDVVYNVETLSHPGPLHTNASSSPAITSAAPDRETSFRLGDLKVLDASEKKKGRSDSWPILRDDLNLKLDMSWREWSCCSACCYRGMNPALCDRMESTQIRRGYVSFFKIHHERELNTRSLVEAYCEANTHWWTLTDCTQRLDEALVSLDKTLSREPYSTEGIPIFSTYFHRTENMRLAESFLNSLFQYRTDEPSPSAVSAKGGSNPFGTLGFYINVTDCGEKKKDCTKLEDCHKE